MNIGLNRFVALHSPVDCQTLVVNVLTPYDRTFHIRLSPSDDNRTSRQ